MLVWAAVLTACAGRGKTRPVQPTDRELVVDATPRTILLGNGLAVLVEPDPFMSTVQVDLRVEVGAQDDPADRKQLSHLVEHVMFALPRSADGAPSLLLGADPNALGANAFVTVDHTYFRDVITRPGLDTALARIARRLEFDCEALTPAAFDNAREVVRNEARFRTGSVHRPSLRRLLDSMFAEGHPYRKEVSDIDTHLVSITREQVCEFIERHYVPRRATIVVVGNVSVDEVRAAAEQHLASVTARSPSPRKSVPAVELGGIERTTSWSYWRSGALVLFDASTIDANDWAATKLALRWASFALEISMRDLHSPIASAQLIRPFEGADVDLVGFLVFPNMPNKREASLREVKRAISQAFSKEVDERLHDLARQQLRHGFVASMASVDQRAKRYARQFAERRPPGGIERDVRRFDELSGEDVLAVGRQLFGVENAAVIKLNGNGDDYLSEREEIDFDPRPDPFLAVLDEVDPARAHASIPVPDEAPPQIEHLDYQLANGMRVVLVRSSKFPVVDARLIVHAGVEAGEQSPQLAELAVGLYGLHEGHRFGRGQDAHALMQHFRQTGSTLTEGVGRRSTVYRATGLSNYLDFIMAGLAERVVQGEYQSGTFAPARLSLLLEWDLEEPSRKANKRLELRRALYGEGHPHATTGAGTRSSIAALDPADVWRFHDRYYRAGNCTLVVTGGFDMERATEYIEAFFGSPALRRRASKWQSEAVPAPVRASEPPRPDSAHLVFIDSPSRAQSRVTIAAPLAEVYGDDHAALLVLAEMLNLSLRSVRESLAASYGFFAAVKQRPPRLIVAGDLDNERAGQGAKSVLASLDAMMAEGESQRLFVVARARAVRDVAAQQGDAARFSAAFTKAVQAGQPDDYYVALTTKIAQLRPEQVRELAQRVLDPERRMLEVVGPAEVRDAVMEQTGYRVE